jgi:acyl-CoA synthetase (AMP-forming)/AMP-acid ligase II
MAINLKITSAKYESLTFAEIDQRINHYANTFFNLNLKMGDRVLVFVKPSLDFPIIIFSLFRAGLVPVFIDPGMGIDSMLQCIQKAKAKALVGIPKIHHLRLLKPFAFSSIEVSIVVAGRALNALSFETLLKKNSSKYSSQENTNQTSLAAILFTSGGTGVPKGVLYTHGMFIEQTLKLKQMFKLTPQDRDYPCFPLFGLFSLALGLTVIMPEVDLMKPADVNGKTLFKSLTKHKITFTTGSPALWINVASYAVRKKLTLPSIKGLATFGAPVSIKLHADLAKVLTHGELYTPYGATECLPVSLITSREILGETKIDTLQGAGTCVGYPAPNTEIKILCLDSKKILTSPNSIGEILVHSSTMTKGYDSEEASSTLIQYHCPDSHKIYHRMGDMGKLDEFGRLWFLGRVVHCFKLAQKWLCTEEIEPAINYLPEVSRSALIRANNKIQLVIERNDGLIDLPESLKDNFFQKIRATLATLPKGGLVDEILLDSNFPVDTRHNIKIDRLLMTRNFSHQTKGLGLL